MKNKMTAKQASFIVSLINKSTGSSYRFVSQITEDGIGKRANKVRGLSTVEASEIIEKWSA